MTTKYDRSNLGGILGVIGGSILAYAMYSSFWMKEEEFMALKKSERLTRSAEILGVIHEGFREAHESHHPGLSGFVAALASSVRRLHDAAQVASGEEAAEAARQNHAAEEATKDLELQHLKAEAETLRRQAAEDAKRLHEVNILRRQATEDAKRLHEVNIELASMKSAADMKKAKTPTAK